MRARLRTSKWAVKNSTACEPRRCPPEPIKDAARARPEKCF
jgi:hypothetical protein